jgi:hypothetical protein
MPDGMTWDEFTEHLQDRRRERDAQATARSNEIQDRINAEIRARNERKTDPEKPPST